MKGVVSIATLQEKWININPKLTVSRLILLKEFMDSLGFVEVSKIFFQSKDNRLYWKHDNISLLEQLLFQMVAGYAADSSAKLLKEYSVFHLNLTNELLLNRNE